MKKLMKYIPVLFLSLAATSNGAAQASDASGNFFSEYLVEITLGVALVVSILVLLVLIVVLNVLKTFVNMQKQAAVEEAKSKGEEVAVEQEEGFMKSIMKKLTESVPVEREDEVLTDHEYDGIRELDNKLPPWWTALFYITIFFAIVYLLHFHVFMTGPSSAEEYEMQMAAAEEQIQAYQASLALSIDETNVTFTDDPQLLAEGEQIYQANCVACHAVDGGGGVGPNFTDQYWIHGGDIKDLFAIIKNGVPQKGMISWKSQLTPQQMQAVASYILTFQGTTPANPKEPQGELYVPEEEGNESGEESQEPEGSEGEEDSESTAISMN